MVTVALAAADKLAEEGLDIEVVDPRTLMPLDEETIMTSVRKTGYALVVDEAPQSYGATAEIAARIGEKAFDYLDAPVMRIGAADLPIPFSPPEFPTIPDVETWSCAQSKTSEAANVQPRLLSKWLQQWHWRDNGGTLCPPWVTMWWSVTTRGESGSRSHSR